MFTADPRFPEGEYGAGTVVVWDSDTYEPIGDEAVAAALADGHLKVRRDGTQIRGGYLFQHTRRGGEDRAWLMVKLDDEGADRRRKPAVTQPASVLSGKRNEDL